MVIRVLVCLAVVGYEIVDSRIGEMVQMMLSAKTQNPPQRSENGLFLSFGRGVFLVKALEEKLPEQHQKEEAWGGTQGRDKVKKTMKGKS